MSLMDDFDLRVYPSGQLAQPSSLLQAIEASIQSQVLAQLGPRSPGVQAVKKKEIILFSFLEKGGGR